MWAVLKIDIKNLAVLKNDFVNKLAKDVEFYIPKLKLKKFFKKKKIYKRNFTDRRLFTLFS